MIKSIVSYDMEFKYCKKVKSKVLVYYSVTPILYVSDDKTYRINLSTFYTSEPRHMISNIVAF